MSEVAGRMSIQAGANCLEKAHGGRGVLLGRGAGRAACGRGHPGRRHRRHQCRHDGPRPGSFSDGRRPLGGGLAPPGHAQFGTDIRTMFSTRTAVETLVAGADLVIGGVLIPGAAAPKLVTAEMVKSMKPGAVVVDVAIDQGGCFETSRATTHSDPTYVVDEVVHYCVANMPGGVARTSTFALNNVTLPFAITLANKGYKQALEDDPHLREGLNVMAGQVTNQPVAEALGYEYLAATKALGRA